jgi:ComF family protein
MRHLLSGLCDLLSPPACAACAGLIDARTHGFCDGCGLLIEPAPRAARGALDLDACVYGGPVRDALHRLKYQGQSELAPVLAELLEEHARTLAGQVDCVAAMPLYPGRLRARGYNQSALLARPVARLLSVPFKPALLRRVRDTEPQVGKTRQARQQQLTHAFVSQPAARGRAVLVIDDVRTTGASLDEARRALLAAGAHAVFTLALACAPAEHESA